MKTKNLKGLAHNFLDWFLSRNNDYVGKWFLGNLKQLSKKSRNRVVKIDLMEAQYKPLDLKYIDKISDIKSELIRQANSLKLVEAICDVHISIDFNTSKHPPEYRFRSLRGENFEVKLEIVDINNKIYCKTIIGKCYYY